ncbi:MAG: twin-arginine translocase subunit TatC [Solirubrobacteraceae bacterium]
MARVLRPIRHEDRLSVVDHLGELRSRLIVCALALAVAFGVCFWQNHRLLRILNQPLPTPHSFLAKLPPATDRQSRALQATAQDFRELARSHSQSASDRALFGAAAANLSHAAKSLPRGPTRPTPITIGVGEPFTTTLTVSFYFAILVSLPLLLYEAYAFVLPAMTRPERRVALPLMALAPLLFIAGVVFTYAIVLKPAVHFLQGYNSQSFDALVQARQLYDFEIMVMGMIGLAFQLPLALLALDYLGVLNSRTLIKQWRYAVVLIAVIAAALPGPDPVTTALETLPLIVLYLLSIVLLKITDRRLAARARADFAAMDGPLDATG